MSLISNSNYEIKFDDFEFEIVGAFVIEFTELPF